MMAEQVESFIDGLIEKTREKKLDWIPFSMFKDKREIIVELENGRGGFDYGINSIRESNSYFLQAGDGFVFLFEMIYLEPGHIRPLRKFARIKVSKTFFMIAVVTAYFLLSIFEWIIPHFSSFFQYPICILGNRISL